MFCPKCGQSLPDDAAFCIRCGLPMHQISSALEQRYHQTQTTSQGQALPNDPMQQPQTNPPQNVRMTGPMTTPWGSTSVWNQQTEVPAQPTSPTQFEGEPSPSASSQTQFANTNAVEEPNRKLVPDHTFSKFVDRPDPPLPFYIPKVIMGIVTVLAAAFLLFQCYLMGTFRLIMGHATDNIRGMSLLIVAGLLVIAGLTTIGSKKSKGAAGTGAVCYFLAAGFAFVRLTDCQYFIFYAAVSIIFAMVNLISAAGGVNIDLDA